jgi:RNA polymerase sigma factor (sigma-70 family)
MSHPAARSRSEVELFNALPRGGTQVDLDEYRTRVVRCVRWLVARRPSGPLVAGDVDDMADEVIARLEAHLRPRNGEGGGHRYTGTQAQFRCYLYRTVASVYADTVTLRVRARSLDEPVAGAHRERAVRGDVLDGLQEWPTAGEDLERPDVQAWVRQALGRLPQRARRWLLAFHRDGRRIREIAGEYGVRSNTVEVALSRGRVSFRRAFLDTVLGGGDGRFRARIDEAARRLPKPHAAVFRAYWTDGLTPDQTAAALGLATRDVSAVLLEAEERVWRMLPEDGTS